MDIFSFSFYCKRVRNKIFALFLNYTSKMPCCVFDISSFSRVVIIVFHPK